MRRAASERDANPADQTSKNIETAFSSQTLRHDGDSESGNKVFRIKAPNISFFLFSGEIKQAKTKEEEKNELHYSYTLFGSTHKLSHDFATVQCVSSRVAEALNGAEPPAGCAEAALLVRKKCPQVR